MLEILVSDFSLPGLLDWCGPGLNCKRNRSTRIRRCVGSKKKTLPDSGSKKIGFDESRASEWIHWFHVDERPICVKQYAVSNISRFMWTGGLLRNNFSPRVLPFFFSSIQIFFTALISLLVINFQLILFFSIRS